MLSVTYLCLIIINGMLSIKITKRGKRMATHKLSVLFIIFISSSFITPLPAYIYRFKRMHYREQNVVVDLLYDCHMRKKKTKKVLWIKQFHPSEQKLYSLLKHLDVHSSCDIDLIWETWHERKPAPEEKGVFLSLAPSQLQKSLKHKINFICADNYRINLLMAMHDHILPGSVPFLTITTKAFAVPFVEHVKYSIGKVFVDLPSSTSALIEKQYGPQVCKNLKKFQEDIKQNLFKDTYPQLSREEKLDYLNDFILNFNYHNLVDFEMLSYILSSSKKRIIVYAGGLHCQNIALFLKENGFTVKAQSKNYHLDSIPPELNPSRLDILSTVHPI